MRYFAIQVMSGREEAFQNLFRKACPDNMVHVVKKKIQSRRKGKPVTLVNPLFPGYLFLECDDETIPAAVLASLKRTKHFTRVLPATDRMKPLDEKDSNLIAHLLSFGREIGTSLVTFDENNRIHVISGPLAGMEGRIIRVDRRKRRAKVKLSLEDSPLSFDLGFEVLEKLVEGTP